METYCVIIGGIFSLKAVITGASAGIGREIANALSIKGYDIVAVGRNANALSTLASSLNSSVQVETVDLSSADNAKTLFEKHKDADVIVNCAGVGVFGEFNFTSLDRELEMIGTNVIALHVLTKLYYAEFVKRGRGNILNVASSAAYFIGPAYSSYYATKAYVHRLTRALSRESERCGYGVKLTLFCPGPVKTQFGKTDGIADGSGAITAELAALKAVNGMLKGKEVVFPDLKTRFLVCISRVVPEKLMSRLVYRQQLKKVSNASFALVKNLKI